MNKLYLIYRKDEIDWDEYIAFVISAKNTCIVRQIASKHACDEGSNTWKSPKYSKIRYLGKTRQKQGIILDSFKAG